MRTFGFILACSVLAGAGDAVDEDRAKEAIKQFRKDYKAREVEVKQNAIYNLHDVPHDLVLEELEKVMRNRDPKVRHVGALAIGGQVHDRDKAGGILMKVYKKDFKHADVLSSTLEALTELGYMAYWPQIKPAMRDDRNSIVIRVLDMLGKNRDYRALPELLEMYKVAMPKRVTWKTGETHVDTGTAGDADQKAAEAEFNKKYGRGGSKAKRAAKAKAAGFDERNFDTQLRKCVKLITGQSFDNALDFQEWYLDHYVELAVKAAELSGEDPEKAAAKAEAELPELRREFEEELKKLEEELAKAAGK